MKKYSGIITGSWEDVTLICGGTHAEPVEMVLQQGPASLFYACPKYHAENRLEGERACSNRLSIEDYTKMLEHLHGVIIDAELNDQRIQLANFTWRDRKGTVYKVVSQNMDKLVISVYNKRAVHT
ncbi:MAG: hypothetical protein IJA20_08615 [Methanocorpusculum sp.]|nr:hypothetical protein [Methanocorpusculum sp.]